MLRVLQALSVDFIHYKNYAIIGDIFQLQLLRLLHFEGHFLSTSFIMTIPLLRVLSVDTHSLRQLLVMEQMYSCGNLVLKASK